MPLITPAPLNSLTKKLIEVLENKDCTRETKVSAIKIIIQCSTNYAANPLTKDQCIDYSAHQTAQFHIGDKESVRLSLPALAAQCGDVGLIEYFTKELGERAHISKPNHPSPLHIACFFGKNAVVQYLLEHNILPDSSYQYTQTSMLRGGKYTSKLLNTSPLAIAAKQGHVSVVKTLLLASEFNELTASELKKLKSTKVTNTINARLKLWDAELEYSKLEKMDPFAIHRHFFDACQFDKEFVGEYIANCWEKINVAKESNLHIEDQYPFLLYLTKLYCETFKTPLAEHACLLPFKEKVIDHIFAYNLDMENEGKLFASDQERRDFIKSLDLIKGFSNEASLAKSMQVMQQGLETEEVKEEPAVKKLDMREARLKLFDAKIAEPQKPEPQQDKPSLYNVDL